MAAPSREEVLVLFFADVDPAAAAADEHAGVRLPGPQSGIGPGFAPGDDAKERRARISLRIGPAIVLVVTVERRRHVDGDLRDGCRHLTGIRRGVELRDGARRGTAAADVTPEAIAADAERRHDTDAGDDDAPGTPGTSGTRGTRVRASCAVTIIERVSSPDGRVSRPGRVFAWLGALLFGTSLAYFLFSYAITFGENQQTTPLGTAIAWDLALFTLFALHHSVFARERVRSLVARTVPAALERSFYVWIASLLLIAVCALWRPVTGVAWSIAAPLGWLMYGVLAARRLDINPKRASH